MLHSFLRIYIDIQMLVVSLRDECNKSFSDIQSMKCSFIIVIIIIIIFFHWLVCFKVCRSHSFSTFLYDLIRDPDKTDYFTLMAQKTRVAPK